MKDCLLSIIIPIYQVEDYISDCLYSICRQNLKDYSWFEVVCVNDGTKDKSMQIVQMVAAEFPHITFNIVNKENGGVSDARNVGIESAMGTYVWFIDSDDVILEGALSVFYESLCKCEVDVVSGLFYMTDCVDLTKSVYRGGNKNNKSFFTSCINRKLLNDNSVRFAKDVAYGEDLLFFETVVFLAKAHKDLPLVVYAYRQRPNSAMNNNSEVQKAKYISSLEKRLEYYTELDLKYCRNISLEDSSRRKYFLNLRDAVVRNILLYHLKNDEKQSLGLLRELKVKGVYPYRLRWNDLCEFYAISDYIIKLFCFLFPFSWYYRFVAKCYSLFVRL